MRVFLLMIVLCVTPLQLFAATDQSKCLDGFELTAIVVLENDIRQSVEAFACRVAFPQDSSTYSLFNQLREKWKKQRNEQKLKRDKVYQRIYGDAWQQKVDSWTQAMALAYSKDFTPSDIACHDLRNELGAHASDWNIIYNSAARAAANEQYDPLRCDNPTVIKINPGAN